MSVWSRGSDFGIEKSSTETVGTALRLTRQYHTALAEDEHAAVFDKRNLLLILLKLSYLDKVNLESTFRLEFVTSH